MRSSTARTALILCAAAALAAATGAASAAPQPARAAAAPRPRQAPPVLVDCLWHPDVRPTNFILACGDGNSRLVSLHWSHWNGTSATAKGVNMVNDCKPYCAAGRFHAYPVVVKLDHPQPWKKKPHQRHYTRMTLVYPDGRPQGFDRTVTYPLWN
ncbi:hypothetical protein ACGFS9_01200 [Streptomyces sp. NPDC048566]|uniref:hypothetical protein n=1 Tax=Streptomyces sp. NPDC048566 TaxID=3365569 RepID=UPI003712080E